MEQRSDDREPRRSDGVVWVTPGSPGALDTMRDVERALALARLGTPALSRGLATVAATWPLDPDGLPARRPGLRGGLVHAYRKLVHRFLW